MIKREITSQQVGNNINSIDLFKWIMALIVISHHTDPLKVCTNPLLLVIYNYFIDLVVPFFFVASSYLLFRKMDGFYGLKTNLDRIKLYGLKILKFYIAWNIVYLPLTVYGYIQDGTSFLGSVIYFFQGLILVGEHFYSWPLWYLLSSLYALTFIYLLLRIKLNEKAILILSIILFLISLLMTYLVDNQNKLTGAALKVSNIIAHTFINGRVFTGAAYISFGMIIAKYNVKLRSIFSVPILAICILAGIFLPSALSSLTRLVVTFVFFTIILSIRLKDRNIWYYFRKSSTVLFFSHMIFLFIFTLIFKQFPYFGLDAFCFSLVCTMLLSVLVIILDRKKGLKILKVLFN